MRTNLSLALIALTLTPSLVACTSESLDAFAEEDAIADATPPGKADAPTFPLGAFTAQRIDHEAGEPLIVAFHPGGEVDLARFVDDEDTTEHITGTYQLYTYRGAARVRILDDSGTVVLRSDWSVEEGLLVFAGEPWDPVNALAGHLANCVAFDVMGGPFEESFSVYEYPTVDLEDARARYAMWIGSSGVEPGEYSIDVKLADGMLVATATGANDQIALRVPDRAPRRAQLLHRTLDEDQLSPIASLVCP